MSIVQLLPSKAYPTNASTSLCTKFVHTSTNKIRCPVNVVTVRPRHLVYGCDEHRVAYSGHLKGDAFSLDLPVVNLRYGMASPSILRLSFKHMIPPFVLSVSHILGHTLPQPIKVGS